MAARLLRPLAAALAALALLAAPAVASLADEVSEGRALAAQLDRGDLRCATLTDTQFERLGEYVMDRMTGSPAVHAAMNSRMEQALGHDNTERMHQLMGRRFAGCPVGDTSSVPFASGMMGTGAGMMTAPGWRWMDAGAWQRMSTDEWRGLAGSMMGARYSAHHGWTTAGIVAVALAALALGAVLAVLLIRRPPRRPSPPTPASA